MNIRYALRATILICVVAKAYASTGNPAVAIWGERETGNQTAGWTAMELPDGRMAIGGHSLLIFDGDRWQSFKMGNTYAIRGLDLGPNGELWAGAANELGVFKPTPDGGYAYHSLNQNLPKSLQEGFFVWHTFTTASGAIYITNKAILTWNGSDFTINPTEFTYSATAFKIEDGVVVVDPKSGTYLINDTGTHLLIDRETIDPISIRWGFGQSKQLNLLTRQGLLSITPQTPSSIKYYSKESNQIFSKIISGAKMRNGEIYLATKSDGIFELTPDGDLRFINIGTHHAVRSIYGITGNSDGSIWLLLRENIARVTFTAEIFDSSHGITGSPVTVISKFKGLIYASTDDGIFRLSEGRFKKTDNSPSYRAWAMRNIGDKNLAIAADEGLWLFDGINYKHAKGTKGVFQIGYTDDAAILATAALGISSTKTNSLITNGILEKLPDIPTSITGSSPDKFWFGTPSKGAYYAERNEDAFIYSRIMIADEERTIDGPATIIRTTGRTILLNKEGIFIESEHPNIFRKIAPSLGYVHEYSNPDSKGRIWLSLAADIERGLTNRIGRISISGDALIWESLDLQLRERAGSPFSIHTDDSHVWLGTDFGVVKYIIPEAVIPRVPRTPLIKITGHQRPPQNLLQRDFEYKSRIAVRYSSLEYASREALRFQTKLVGIDPDWSAPTNEAAIEFAGLREGGYEFMVRSTIDGFPSEPASVKFTILPPWWRTKSAYSIYALGVVSAIIAGIRLRERSQKKRTDLLKAMVDQRTEQLLRANEAKTEFLTAMSHDVRTPINGIIGSTLELTRSPLTADQRELVRRIEACSGMLGTLVEDVLDFAAIESGQALIGDGAFSPKSLLDSVATILGANSPEGAGQIAVAVAPDVPSQLRGDAYRIRQILVNYGSNAMKYGGPGEIALRLRRDDHLFLFSVIDSGPGIPEQDQKRLFSRFSRINPTPGKEGKGLGLAGCRAIARLMNGAVGVQSGLGQGSEFWLRIPLGVPSASETIKADTSDVRYDQRALLVEDVNYSAEASRSVLESLGLSVSIATTGTEAIERLKSEPFDVVFLDINLPDLSGMAVAIAIRSLSGAGAYVRIIATTAHSTTEHKAECIRAGMNGFMSKPLTPEKVHLALGRSDVICEERSTPRPRISFAMLDFLAKGSPAELRRHAYLLLSGIDEEMASIEGGIADHDREKIKRTAHRMITHARLAGDPNLIDLAASLEDLAQGEPFASLGQCAIKLKAEIAVVREKLEDHLRRVGSA